MVTSIDAEKALDKLPIFKMEILNKLGIEGEFPQFNRERLLKKKKTYH